METIFVGCHRKVQSLDVRNTKIGLYLICFSFLFFSIFRTRVRNQGKVTGHTVT